MEESITRLATLAAKAIVKNGGIVDFANMSEFDCPSFNQDLEVNDYHPAGAEELRKRLLANDAVIVSPPNTTIGGNRGLWSLRVPFEHLGATKNYPCIKKAWVEFLGEKPDPVTERVE